MTWSGGKTALSGLQARAGMIIDQAMIAFVAMQNEYVIRYTFP